AQPTNPLMIWDITPTTGFQTRTVSWRGNGTDGADQFVPEVFMLSAGNHQLLVRGREANTRVDKWTFVPQSNPTTVSGFFVDNSGSPACADATANGSEGHPWCTIPYALAHVAGGATIYVKQGTYTDYLAIAGPSGTTSQPTVLAAYPGQTVTLRGTGYTG